MLTETTIKNFKASLRGDLIQRSDERYDDGPRAVQRHDRQAAAPDRALRGRRRRHRRGELRPRPGPARRRSGAAATTARASAAATTAW